ncbi:MAG: Card1-like endonuclease domain-containing protein, partial [Wenzhouxiangellaceae bacterium]
PRPPARPLREALEGMQSAGLLDFDGDRELILRSADACRYIAGGWMEEYAWLTAAELGAEHVHAGLELTWNAGSGTSPRNELDLFVLHHNRALTVECKTSNMGEGETTAKIRRRKGGGVSRVAGGVVGWLTSSVSGFRFPVAGGRWCASLRSTAPYKTHYVLRRVPLSAAKRTGLTKRPKNQQTK